MSEINQISNIWISNIKKLDEKNHLAHGEIYAGDGSVHDLIIDGNTVKAKVDGAPSDVYNVKITFKKLSKIKKKKILDLIQNNPNLYSKILNNQIPIELFNYNVKIIPDSLKDFKMNCDCDRGLFCKHKAAVFHKLKSKIQNDPFLIFTLLDFDLKDEFQSNNLNIKTIRQVLRDDGSAILNNSGSNVNYFFKLNFILSDFPPFYDSKFIDFNKLLYDTLDSMSQRVYNIQHMENMPYLQEYIRMGGIITTPLETKQERTPLEIQKDFEDKWLNPQMWDSFKIDINGNYNISNIATSNVINNFNTNDLKFQLFAFFAELSQIDFDNYCEDIKFLHELYRFTLHLIHIGALIPEFFSLDNGEYHIRWKPVHEVSIFFDLKKFYDKCPDNILTFYNTELSKQSMVNNLISIFFEGYSSYYMYNLMPYVIRKHSNEFYFRLFFGKNQDFNRHNYDGHQFDVENWLAVLKQKDYNLTINVNQSDFEFVLNLDIDVDGEMYSVGEVLADNPADIVRSLSIVENVFSKFDFDYDFNTPRSLPLREFTFFIDKIAPILTIIGVNVVQPKELSEIQDVKLILEPNFTNAPASLSIDDLVNFDWKVAIGDETYSIDEFKTFSQNYKGLVKIRDKFFMVNGEDLDKILESIYEIPEKKTKSEMIQYLLTRDIETVKLDEKLNNLLKEVLEVKDIEIPKSLDGKLRKYQKTGFSWMLQNMKLGFGSILADDMGLGKTLQLLTAVLYLKENNYLDESKVLVVAPTSILTNWAKEVQKFTPSLKAEIYHGQNRQLPSDDYDILLTSYGVLRKDLDKINSHDWFLFVIDEAQNIKNPKAKQTIATKSVNATHHVALSGTPVENHLSEYWSIFDFINEGYLYGLKQFRDRFINPIEKHRDLNVLNDFKKITSPFILRRLKTDKNIIKDLPEKIVNDVYCNLTVKQASMYEETLNQLIKEIEESHGIKRKGLVLKLITALKQICNHPAHFSKSDEYKIAESGKMEVLMNILENILDNDEKVLIFTQYVEMGNIMKELIEKKFDQEVMFLHGGVSRDKRDVMVDKFQNGDNKIFILSLRAGGIGLNLTAALNVIHYDLWWNPAVENQATDRAYRIGQKDNVMVYRFITSGTLEERINQILLEKRQLVEMTIEGNESFITEMTNDELRDMVNLRSNQ